MSDNHPAEHDPAGQEPAEQRDELPSARDPAIDGAELDPAEQRDELPSDLDPAIQDPAGNGSAELDPAAHDPAKQRDELPTELDPSAYVGPYVFPDNRRRIYPGALYLGFGVALLALWAARRDGVLVNEGMLVAGVLLVLAAAYHALAAVPLKLRETDALVEATRHVGFPVGHASAQLAWRGLRSRPTWRILLYSADEPPTKRGFVLVDAVDGTVVQDLVEDNPEDWSVFGVGTEGSSPS